MHNSPKKIVYCAICPGINQQRRTDEFHEGAVFQGKTLDLILIVFNMVYHIGFNYIVLSNAQGEEYVPT